MSACSEYNLIRFDALTSKYFSIFCEIDLLLYITPNFRYNRRVAKILHKRLIINHYESQQKYILLQNNDNCYNYYVYKSN